MGYGSQSYMKQVKNIMEYQLYMNALKNYRWL